MAASIQTISLPTPTAAFYPLTSWEMLTISGKDRVDFLKGLLTNTIRKLSPGDGNPTLYLTVKGRMEGEALLCSQEDEILLLSPPGEGQKLYDFLNRYHIMEDITLNLSQQYQPLLCTGHTLSPLLEAFELSLPDMNKGLRLDSLLPTVDVAIWGTRYPILQPLETLVIWTRSEDAPALMETLQQKGCPPLSETEFLTLRAAYQWYDSQQDLEGLLVHEARLEETHVDFAKGCFVGQEVVARTQHRGQATKYLYTLRASEPLPDNALIQDESGKEVGKVVSQWILSDHTPLYRALLKHKMLEEAEQLQAVVEERAIPIQLVEFTP